MKKRDLHRERPPSLKIHKHHNPNPNPNPNPNATGSRQQHNPNNHLQQPQHIPNPSLNRPQQQTLISIPDHNPASSYVPGRQYNHPTIPTLELQYPEYRPHLPPHMIRQPVIIHTYSPKVIQIESHQFRQLVQRLTGPDHAATTTTTTTTAIGSGAGSMSSHGSRRTSPPSKRARVDVAVAGLEQASNSIVPSREEEDNNCYRPDLSSASSSLSMSELRRYHHRANQAAASLPALLVPKPLYPNPNPSRQSSNPNNDRDNPSSSSNSSAPASYNDNYPNRGIAGTGAPPAASPWQLDFSPSILPSPPMLGFDYPTPRAGPSPSPASSSSMTSSTAVPTTSSTAVPTTSSTATAVPTSSTATSTATAVPTSSTATAVPTTSSTVTAAPAIISPGMMATPMSWPTFRSTLATSPGGGLSFSLLPSPLGFDLCELPALSPAAYGWIEKNPASANSIAAGISSSSSPSLSRANRPLIFSPGLPPRPPPTTTANLFPSPASSSSSARSDIDLHHDQYPPMYYHK